MANNCFAERNIGQRYQYQHKPISALPISAEWNARIPSRHEKQVKIIIKDENGTVLSSPKGSIELQQDFEEKTVLMITDSLVSVGQETFTRKH